MDAWVAFSLAKITAIKCTFIKFPCNLLKLYNFKSKAVTFQHIVDIIYLIFYIKPNCKRMKMSKQLSCFFLICCAFTQCTPTVLLNEHFLGTNSFVFTLWKHFIMFSHRKWAKLAMLSSSLLKEMTFPQLYPSDNWIHFAWFWQILARNYLLYFCFPSITGNHILYNKIGVFLSCI